MSAKRCVVLSIVMTAGLFAARGMANDSHQQGSGSSRQYYSMWQSHPQTRYYYRTYYYKPAPEYYGYKHHYVIYSSHHPEYLYFYNPYKKLFWGRCPAHHTGQAQYSLLAESDRRASLDKIPDSAFPSPGPMPPIPESRGEEGANMDMPPDDLPASDSLPK